MRGLRAILLLAAAAVLLCAVSCSARAELEGTWRSEARDLSFRHNEFTIHYKGSESVRSIRGLFSIAGSTATLSFREYEDSSGNWLSLAGTDLEGHAEKIRFGVRGDTLTTLILASDKVYSYHRAGGEGD
jgi:hypothetical protein